MSGLAWLSWRWLWSRPLTTALHAVMLALGFSAMVVLAGVSEQLQAQTRRDLAGIDLVVGAKGSPLQLILAGVFHIDVPPGNVPASTTALLAAQPLVAQAVPISLGDSHRGYRIVGTQEALIGWYGAALAGGRVWTRPMEAVLGAEVVRRTGLSLGARVAGSHGLGDGGASHGEHPYEVVGVLAPCGCVLDRLILTDIASVWAVHEHHAPVASTAAAPAGQATGAADGASAARGAGRPQAARASGAKPARAASGSEHDHDHDQEHDHDHDHGPKPAAAPTGQAAVAASASPPDAADDDREVTMVLVRYRSPLAAASMPRWVQAQPALQAAVPALEAARLFRMLGVGLDLVRALAGLLLVVATLSIFVALTHAVREREPDLAMMRLLGASPARVAGVVLAEALWLVFGGLALGLLLGHGLLGLIGSVLDAERTLTITGWWWTREHAILPVLAVMLALAAVAWPLWRVSRLEVTRALQAPP